MLFRSNTELLVFNFQRQRGDTIMPSYSGDLPERKQFYVYTHARPDGSVFYVGKGHGKRAGRFSVRNPHHKNVVAKHGRQRIIVSKVNCKNEQCAFDLEQWMIRIARKMGIGLVNRTNGGEGSTGLVMSQEARAQIFASLMGRKGTPHTPESKAKISAARMNRPARKK